MNSWSLVHSQARFFSERTLIPKHFIGLFASTMAEGSSRFSSWIFVKILRLKFGDNLKLNFGQDLEVDVWSGRPVGTKSQLNPKWGAPFNASWKCLPTPVWPDRDDFIEVNFENISPKMRNNFVKRPLGNARSHAAGSVNPKNTPYDAHSANQMWKETFLEWWCFYCYQMLLHSTPPLSPPISILKIPKPFQFKNAWSTVIATHFDSASQKRRKAIIGHLHKSSFHLLFMVLHYGPYEGSNDSTKEAIIFRNNLLDNWNGINPDDPLSTVDKVATFAWMLERYSKSFENDLFIEQTRSSKDECSSRSSNQL